MNLRFLGVVAVAVMLAACASKKEQAAGTTATAAPPPAATKSAVDPSSLEYFNTVVGNTVLFDYDKYDLRPDAQAVLRGQAAWLNQQASRTLTIEGHCDERGTREYNLGLGERRANAVKNYLQSLGVNANRIKTISYGKERPVCVQSNDACWDRNRRGVSAVQ